MLLNAKFLITFFLCTSGLLAQQKPKAIKSFTQKDFEAYKFEENKYDLRTKNSFHYLRTESDTTSYFLDPSDYKGIINYGVDFASRDKRTFNFIENYEIYYTDIAIQKCSFSVSDSIAEIEGQITGGWNSVDFKGKPPLDIVEISVGVLKKSTAVVNFGYFNFRDFIVTYKGEEKKKSFPLDTLNTFEFQKLDFRKNFPASTPFKVRFKVDPTSVLSIGKLASYVHLYAIGEMFFTKQKKATKPIGKKDKNAPRFVRIIENNVQVNDPKNQIKKETPVYYQLTEKAETYILTRQYAKAKETYSLLAKNYPTLFARDIHNAIRVAVLSRDVKMAFWWSEKLAEKGVELPYFNTKIFNGLKKNPEWKSFSKKYDSICKLSQSKWNTNLKKQIIDLLNEEYWEGLINGKSGAAPITYYDTEKHKTKFACEIKDFNIENYMDRKESRRMDKFAQYAVAASEEAIQDAGITPNNVNKQRVGVIWGAGIGGLETFQEEVISYAQGDGTPRFNPFFIPKMIADIAPAHISMRNGFMGPNYTTVSACASSANAMIDAFNYIRLGMCDVIISGGSEAAVTIAGMGGFNSMQALSTRNDSPETASRPFDATRDGFVLGEGAGALVLEEYEHAKARGAKIYCELGGGGMSSDAYHLTAPHPDGIGVIAVMENTLRDAGMSPEQVDHINTHGTSTPLGDVAELKAISHVFGDHAKNININSTKSMTGHLLGAAGAIEAIASILAMKYGIVPPTINHTVVDENIDPSLNLTLNKAQKRDIKVAMSNTFGFGGHNACVLFKKLED